MKRALPFVLMVATVGWVYACSSSKTEEPATNNDAGGGGNGDSGGPTENDSGGPVKEDGGTPDAPVTPTGNPIEGAGAPTAITGGDFNEAADGPVWRNNKLYYTLPESMTPQVIEHTPPTTFAVAQTYTDLAPIGQTVDTKGNSVITTLAELSATPTRNALLRWSADAGATTAIDLKFDASAGPNPWDSPNDVVARADGTLYVTDPGYQRDHAGGTRVNRLYRITTAGNVFEEKVYEFGDEPNGIGLSPDGNTLYVSLTAGTKIVKYPVAANGTLGAEAAFTTTGTQPDGLCVDTAGNVYVAVASGVEVYKPDGTKWGAIPVPKTPSAVGFGGADLKTLYITAQGAVYQVTGLKVAGTTQ